MTSRIEVESRLARPRRYLRDLLVCRPRLRQTKLDPIGLDYVRINSLI